MVVLWLHENWRDQTDKDSRDDLHAYEVRVMEELKSILGAKDRDKCCEGNSSGRNTAMKYGFVYLALKYKDAPVKG